MSPRPHPRSANGLLEFLAAFAAKFGADALPGSILLLRLEREVDDLISFALGLSKKYHPGRPSPWSHNVLITAPYQVGQPIPILDCTIRDANGDVDWNMSLREFLSKPLTKQGGIYAGHVSDYVDVRVTRFGIKFMPALSMGQRDNIVSAAWALQKKGYYYDIPGLFRELSRFLFGIAIPPSKKLLFCSSFCQKAYFDALGPKGLFAPPVIPEDTSDDEIWYPNRGTRYPETVPLPAAVRQLALASPGPRRKRRG